MTVLVSVRPASSSFFAGEHFVCYITFTNPNPRQPQPREVQEEDQGEVAQDEPVPETQEQRPHKPYLDRADSNEKYDTDGQDGQLANAAPRKPSTPIGRLHPHSRKMSIRNDFHLAFPQEDQPQPTTTTAPLRPQVASPLFPSASASASMTSLASMLTANSSADTQPSRRFSLSSTADLKGRTPSGSAHILYSFAQLSGSFQLDESIIKPAEFNALKQRLVDLSSASASMNPGGAGAIGAGVFGGGDLGHEVQLDVDERVGWGSYLRNALSSGQSSPSLNGNFTAYGSPNLGQEWGSPYSNSATSTPRSLSSRHMPSASLAVPAIASPTNGFASSSSPIMGPSSPSISRRRVSHKRTGSTLQDTRERTLLNRNIPTLSTPPSILFVDHVLEPGESKTYSFRLPLPLDLPPSYLGRSIQFTYTLTIGVNSSSHAGSSGIGLSTAAQARLFSIPIRLYNNVALPHGEPAFWDLGNPVIKGRDEGIVTLEPQGPPLALASGTASPDPSPAYANGSAASIPVSSRATKSGTSKGGSGNEHGTKMLDLQNYARALLGLPEEGAESDTNGQDQQGSLSSPRRPDLGLRRTSSSHDVPPVEEVETHTCASATDILATNSPKVSYDISKDGSIAAVLTLVRSRYRLGDTVQGVVSMNAKGALTRIVRVAVTLESYEDIEPTMSMVTPVSKVIKTTKIVHAEHHESTLDKGRVPFSLSIPSAGTPDFKTSAVKLKWTVKLALLTLASVRHPSQAPADGSALPFLPGTPLTGVPPSTPGSTVPSTPSTPSVPTGGSSASDVEAGAAPAAAPVRLAPPPHVAPSKPDGFALYHSAWRAVRHLSGPGMAAAGNPTMLAPVSLERRKAMERASNDDSSPSLDEEKQAEEGLEANDATPKNGGSPIQDDAGSKPDAADDGEKSANAEDKKGKALSIKLPSSPTSFEGFSPPPAFANETRLEIVECAVPVRILPSTTNFAVGDFVFEA
ncbi:Golgi membrane exchange factor (Ric1p-Rgp1p) subunit [Tilletia horrida]|nr:Golgi membrane exchange factor (Ric1p-Rgp1p) subunit [Tilletia horrida]